MLKYNVKILNNVMEIDAAEMRAEETLNFKILL
jgi:hypothetical protein